MTKIQLRRDTAANWTTNNPTPASGEPCFETDTGKFKIGDGVTTYNNLPYQGGSSTPTNMVTVDTDQTITGNKVFFQPNSSNKGLNVALGSNATNPDIWVHIGKSPNSDFTGGMIRFESTSPKIVGLQQNNAGGTMKISSSGDLINYAGGTTEIRNGATWGISKSGIRIPANSKSNPSVEIVGGSNTVGSSSGVDAKISVGREGVGTWAERRGVFIRTSATRNASDSGAKLWLGESNYRSAIYPVSLPTVGRCLNFETYAGDNTNATLSIQKNDVVYTDSDGVAHSLISGGGATIDDSTTTTTSVWSSSKTNTEITTVANEVVQVQGDVASLDGDVSTLKTGVSGLKTDVSGLKTSKQNTLVSGTNIKTINGETILGEGDIAVGGSSNVIDDTTASTTTTYSSSKIDELIGNISTALDSINGEVI